MKLNLCKSIWRMGGESFLLVAGLLLCPLAGMAQEPIYINTGTINNNNLPQVNAINFYNSGTWNISTPGALYETANTLTYTNEGVMEAAPGWEFDLGPATAGSRTNLSAIFFNDNGATIQANDGLIINMPEVTSSGSILLIQATNIINKGNLIATADGQIKLVGSTVTLSRSTLSIPPIQGGGSANNFGQTNYTPDTAIYDEYWGEGFTNLYSLAVWEYGTNAASAAAPNVAVVNPCDATNAAPFLGSNPLPFAGFTPKFYAWTNVVDPSSISNIVTTNASVTVTNRYFRQAVFVVVNDPNIVTNNSPANALIRFTPSGNISNLFQTVSVWLHSTNGGSLYIMDTLGSLTNRGELLNDGGLVPGSNPLTPCTGPAYRPANYLLEREDDSFTNGSSGYVTLPPNNFLYDSSFSNALVTADVSAYQAYVDDLAYDPYGSAVSNLVGRIIIDANNLDLTRTVISNFGPQVTIQANNLTGSAGAVISCQNLSYNLGASNGTVNVLNLATNGTLPALNGTISLWSAEWTNYQTVFIPVLATNNTIEYDFHVLLVDASGLSSTVPVTVQDLILQTNAVVSDSMTVAHTFLFNGQSLTLQGTLNLSGNNLQNWNNSLAPSLLYFTNNGSLFIPNEAHFGDDTAVPYAEFVNAGQIYANSQTIRSLDVQIINGGMSQTLVGGFSATAQSIEMTAGATIKSSANLQLAANTMQLSQSLLLASLSLNISVTNSLTDSGSANFLECGNGFNLYVAPQTGSLSASTIIDTASGGQLIDHAWAGVDSGSSASGTSDNVAIGTLRLVAQNPSQLPTFEFSPATGNNAMYVNTLDLTQLGATAANITSFIQIDPGMKIYFANVLPATLSGQSTATVLQNQFPGQFIQNSNAGQVTSSPIVISRAFYSNDPYFVLTWNATAGATYSILRTNVMTGSSADWPVIKTGYPTGGAAGGPLSYTDTTTTIGPMFYRVRSP